MRVPLLPALVMLVPVIAGCRAEVTIPVLPSQAGLWTASASPAALLRLDSAQLVDTGPLLAATSLTTSSGGLQQLLAIAFDDQGTLWVGSQSDSAVLGFAPGALASGGAQAATSVIRPRAGSLTGPTSLAFDAQARLWVMDGGTGSLNRYDPAQLAAGGVQTAPIRMLMPGSPSAIAFDASGAVWIADHQFNIIVKYPAESLATSESKPPAVVVRDSSHTLTNPAGIAFDAAGNLWVANLSGRTVAAYSPAQLAVGGALLPHVVLSSNAGSLPNPVGLAFDGAGNLWVVNANGVVTEFARASLDASGAPLSLARLSLSGHSLFWSLAFWPKPAGLPLN